MVMVLDLPSEDDLAVVLKYRDKSIETSVLDLDDILTTAAADARRNGDGEEYTAYFQKALKDKFDIDLPKKTTEFLMISMDRRLDELKKKFSLLQDLYDSTISPSTPTDEQSASST